MPHATAEVVIGGHVTGFTDPIALDKGETIYITASTGEKWRLALDEYGRIDVILVEAVGPRHSVAVRPLAANHLTLQAVT